MPFRGTKYTCSITEGSDFLRWRITGLGAPMEVIFSSSNSVGQYFVMGEFGAVLTDLSDASITADLFFDLTEDTIQVICDDVSSNPSLTKSCDIIIKGKLLTVILFSVVALHYSLIILLLRMGCDFVITQC